MDDALATIEQKFHVIHKSEQATAELHMPIRIAFLYESRIAR